VKKAFLTGLLVVLASGFMLAGAPRADAMNNESAAMLAAGIVLFGGPVLHAVAAESYRPAPVYVAAYPSPHYIAHTKFIHARSGYRICNEPFRGHYKRERRDERSDYYRDRGRRSEWGRH
jgi:hypothetical protein